MGNAICDKNIDTIDLVIMLGKRCGFRTRKDIDVSKIAQLYGGGGHKRASGCDITNGLLNDFNIENPILMKIK